MWIYRRDNPNIVATYNKFNESSFKLADGFEVISISLDGLRNRSGELNQEMPWPIDASYKR